jgi:RNA 2',3'-cyclic 3'-phosphodiesterase
VSGDAGGRAQRVGAGQSPAGPIRAFFAVELGAAARRAAEAATRELRGRPGGDGVRWVRPEALHVTLRFLGGVDPGRLAALAACARGELAALRPFRVSLGAAELFPTPRRPRVVSLAVDPEAPLAELAQALERAAGALGLAPEERPFRAHLTLGRVRDRRFPDVAGLAVPAEEVAVDEVVLYRSELAPTGARYSPLERLALGAGAAPTDHPKEARSRRKT